MLADSSSDHESEGDVAPPPYSDSPSDSESENLNVWAASTPPWGPIINPKIMATLKDNTIFMVERIPFITSPGVYKQHVIRVSDTEDVERLQGLMKEAVMRTTIQTDMFYYLTMHG